MRNKIALTSGGPYVGVTTLAKKIAARGYQYVSMSDVLIASFAERLGVTMEYVKVNKSTYRSLLQAYGDNSGYTTFGGLWLEETFKDVDFHRPIVIEKVRSGEQALDLTVLNFDIIALTASPETRLRNAASLGVSAEELAEAMAHPVEQLISDLWIDCYYQIDERESTDWLVDRIITGEGEC